MKVVLITFAGRKNRMYLQENFIKKAIDDNLIDRWDIWNFARKEADSDWIIQNFKDKKNVEIKFGSVKNTGYLNANQLYKECYESYVGKEYEDHLFIKVDDDIIFWDIDYLKDFIEYAKGMNDEYMLSANVINHPHCSAYQYEDGYFDDIGFEINYPKPLYPEKLDGPRWKNHELWHGGKKAERIHEYFCQNHKSILDKAHSHGDQTIEIKKDELFSINFIAFKHKFMKAILKPYEDGYIYDEAIITQEVPRTHLLNSKKLIYKKFIVSHLSYTPQDKSLSPSKIVNLYQKTFLDSLR